MQQGVDRCKHLDGKLMGVQTKGPDIVERIACCHPCAKAFRTDIDGIGTVVDSRDSALQVLGRCQQF